MRVKMLFVAVWAGLLVLTAGRSGAAVYAVWASPQAERTTVLYYAAKSNDAWGAPVQLPLNAGLHVTPVIAEDRQKNIWLVWIEQTAQENILRYAVIRRSETESGRVAQAGNEQSYAPTILIDAQDVPWIAWSGVMPGQMADIYASRWTGTGWAKPVMVNAANQVPDITPLIGLRDKNIVWISWFGMNQEKDYVRYLAELHDGKWRTDAHAAPIEGTKEFIEQRTKREAQIPEQARQRMTGAVFAGLECEIQSVSERFGAFQGE